MSITPENARAKADAIIDFFAEEDGHWKGLIDDRDPEATDRWARRITEIIVSEMTKENRHD